MKKTKKHIVLAFIMILIAVLAFGYAYLTTTLTISGITDIDSNNWDVYFDNVVVTNGSVSGAQEIEAPTITSDTEVEFHVNLKKPGDFYEFTIEARNDGTIDAMIQTVEKKLNGAVVTTLPAYLDYNVTYKYGAAVENNHLLAAESLETYKIRVEYKSNINPSDLPSTAQSLTLSFGVEYVQADDNAVQVVETIYSSSDIYSYIGQSLLSGVTIYDNYGDAVAAFGHPFFLKHTIGNNIVKESYVGFIYNNNVYYLRGGVDEYGLSTKPIFEANKAVMLDAFGSAKCTADPSYYECTDSTAGIHVNVTGRGWVNVISGSFSCSVNDGGGSYCS